MIKFKRDNDALIAIRSAAWRHAKAELMTIVDTISADSVHEVRVYKALVNRIQNFQSNFTEVMDEQDDSIPSTKQPCIDAGSSNDESSKVNAIVWSEVQQPDSNCGHLHVLGETPIGQFLIYWQRPVHNASIVLYFIEESPIGLLSRTGEGSLDSFKQHCQQEYRSHILRCLMSQELPI